MAPLISRCTNRLSGVAEPEVWFRIVHITLESNVGSATYLEQTVEIALGPKGAFENGNIGILTRRVPTGQVVSAVPPPRGNPKPPKAPQMPRVVEFLRKAIEWQTLLASGQAKNQSDIARREGISRVRVSQVMGLLRLTPQIQQAILSMGETTRRSLITERNLRAVEHLTSPKEQFLVFQQLDNSGPPIARV